LKRRRDFDAHEVVRVIQATVSMLITRIGPVWSNDREQHAAFCDFLVQDL